MRIDKNEKIAGLPILQVRDWLREVRRPYVFQKEHVASYFNFSERKAGELLRELKKRGMVELMEGKSGRQGYHQVAMKGNALAMARAMPPITRTKAEELLTGFLSRVVQVNSRDELAWYVHEARVFGSYLDQSAKDFGDVDIAIDVRQRKIEGRDIVKYSKDRARQSGRNFGSWLAMLDYAEVEVWRLLKARKAYLSLHAIRWRWRQHGGRRGRRGRPRTRCRWLRPGPRRYPLERRRWRIAQCALWRQGWRWRQPRAGRNCRQPAA